MVWLQVTGLVFGLIAMFLAQGAWKERAAWRLPVGSHEVTKFWVLVVAFAAFAYFAVSYFVRAWLRERREVLHGWRVWARRINGNRATRMRLEMGAQRIWEQISGPEVVRRIACRTWKCCA